MKNKRALAEYLKQGNRDIMVLKLFQETLLIFILNFVFRLYGIFPLNIEILLLIIITSISYFVLWAMFFKRNRDTISIFYACGYTGRKTWRLLCSAAAEEIVTGCLSADLLYALYLIIAERRAPDIFCISIISAMVMGCYMIIGGMVFYLLLHRQGKIMGDKE